MVYLYNGKEWNEDLNLNWYDYGARYYDPSIGRWNGVDPLADIYPSFSPYAYVADNPLIFTDPTGRSINGEFEPDKEGNWQKVSTKGDAIGVDFYHWDTVDENGNPIQNTYVTDREGNWNIIKNGRNALQGEQRGDNVNWETIYYEWQEGMGPERSFFEGDHPSNVEIKDHYLLKDVYKKFQSSGESKKGYTSGWGPADAAKTGKDNMQAQMMGDYNISFYKLGNKTLTLLQDSKSRTSFYLHAPIKNKPRTPYPNVLDDNRFWRYEKQSTTYQSYLFFQ